MVDEGSCRVVGFSGCRTENPMTGPRQYTPIYRESRSRRKLRFVWTRTKAYEILVQAGQLTMAKLNSFTDLQSSVKRR